MSKVTEKINEENGKKLNEGDCINIEQPLLIKCSGFYKENLNELNDLLYDFQKKINDLDKLTDDQLSCFKEAGDVESESFYHDYMINNEELSQQNAKLKVLLEKLNLLI